MCAIAGIAEPPPRHHPPGRRKRTSGWGSARAQSADFSAWKRTQGAASAPLPGARTTSTERDTRGDGRPCNLRGRKTAPVGALVDRGHVVVAADAVPETRAPGLSGGPGQTLGGGGGAIGTDSRGERWAPSLDRTILGTSCCDLGG